MSHYSSFKLKLIYVFRINDAAHEGCLKIGEATIEGDKHSDFKPNSKDLNTAARNRIRQYTQTAGIQYELLHTQLAFKDFHAIGDHDVHKVLRRSGVQQKYFEASCKRNEWFICNLETARTAIEAALDGKSAIDVTHTADAPDPIAFRDEQQQAIKDAVKRYRNGHKKFLWNAKMRFGKTLCALQVIKEMQFKRVIIFTHRPDVLDGWHKDYGKIFFEKDSNYQFCAKRLGLELDEAERRAQDDASASYIYFASTQDLRGSKQVGGSFEKNDEVFSTHWDLVIIDEAHEGLQTELGRNVRNALLSEGTRELLLSGTPFNLFDEFENDEIFTWDYVMEQRAKSDWTINHALDSNPYEVLPVMHMLTFDLGCLLQDGDTEYADIDDKAFNFREFFRVYTGDPKVDFRPVPVGKKVGDFVHERDVKRFLDLLVTTNVENNMPFATQYNRENFRHTLWMVPGVKEGAALASLLNSHSAFGQFKIVNVAGEGGVDDEVTNNKALEDVRNAMTNHPEDTYTITLSCGKLTTGVNVEPWTAVLMLAGSYSTSAANYMQTIFRVQTPATIGGRMKTDCYVFDFAPDRTLKVMVEAAQVSARAKHPDGEISEKELLGEFLNFCPIISYNGTEMRHFDVNAMMEHLKRVYVDKVVSNGFEDNHLYNDQLLKLDGMALEDFNELKRTIGKTKASHVSNEVDINNQGFTDEEIAREKRLKKKRELTPEEQEELEKLKEKKKNRTNAISILRGISIRMPLMIYGAELADNEEITIDNFADKVDPSSWEEFMPRGVTKEMFAKFTKYYDEDIFRAAGRQIRDFARAADAMSITQRVQRIAGIFSSFRNPDKETVLTPWRVVNMHMSDTLGGYCFYDHEFKETIPDPRFVDRGKVTRDVFAPTDTHVLEINSKSGLYPLYVAYSIFRYRLDNKIGQVDNEQALWDQILRENLFIVCKTPMAKTITQRTLRGFRSTRVNARYFDDLINQIKNKQDNFIKRMAQGNNYWKANSDNNMKFNAIVGNPPYQVMDGGTDRGAIPVYHYFVNIAKRINTNYISMIMPARWYAGGRGLEDFRTDMIEDRHLQYLFDFEMSKDIFPSVDIAGGLCYFLWSKLHDGLCKIANVTNDGNYDFTERTLNEFEIFVRNNRSISILKKITSQSAIYLNSMVLSINPFGFRTYFRGRSEPQQKDLRILTSQGWSYVDRNDVQKGLDYIDKYKIIVGRFVPSNGELNVRPGDGYRVLTSPKILYPGEINTETYIDTAVFNTEKEAQNYKMYLCSKFARFLLRQGISSVNVTRECFVFVPLQDFNEKWTDERLYKKYGLTDEEIKYIESMIKPME